MSFFDDPASSNNSPDAQGQKLAAVGALAGGIAHEFNNLLQAILGYTSCALEGLSPDERRHEDLQQVMRAAGRAAQLTRQLLRFSRREGLQKTVVSPNALITELTSLMRPLLGEQVQLDVRLGAKIEPLLADPCLIEQVLMNLLVNARDAMPDGGRLTISACMTTCDGNDLRPPFSKQRGEYVLFEVSDTGVGMSPEVLERIFEPFFTTKEVGQGTGLGLATAYGIVKQHDGMIYAESAVDQGTTFRVYLPIHRDDAKGECITCPLTPLSRPQTILVAEDEPLVRELAVRVLKSAGFHTIAVADGEQAVAAVAGDTGGLSLVFLDLVMPRLTGREVFEQIKKVRPDLPILFCTGYDPEARGFELHEQDRLDLLEKPFRPDELLFHVRRLVAQHAAQGGELATVA